MSPTDGIWAISVNFKIVIVAVVVIIGQTNEKKPINSDSDPIF